MDAWRQYFLQRPEPTLTEFLSHMRQECYRHETVTSVRISDTLRAMSIQIRWKVSRPDLLIPERFRSHTRTYNKSQGRAIESYSFAEIGSQFDKTYVGQTIEEGVIEIEWIG